LSLLFLTRRSLEKLEKHIELKEINESWIAYEFKTILMSRNKEQVIRELKEKLKLHKKIEK
jgi:hypothetical protein